MPANTSQKLLIRLSSLGDVVLAAAALEVFRRRGEKVDWLVAREFAPLLEGHPSIRRLWVYDRREGFRGWWRLAQQLGGQNYVDVFDLHRTLRTVLFWWSIRVLGRGLRPGQPRPAWHRFSKPRLRILGYLLFKRFWPESWRPTPVVRRMAAAVGGSGEERPDLRYLLRSGAPARTSESVENRAQIAVMPSSRWAGKCWPVDQYVEVLRRFPDHVALVLGTSSDAPSLALEGALRTARLPLIEGSGRWDLRGVAEQLARCQVYLGSDTGLAHLAEALGVPAVMVFGPSTPNLGFGPWRPESRSLGRMDLGCRPCSKDGRRCLRLWDRYACLRGLPAQAAVGALAEAGLSPRPPTLESGEGV